MLNNFRWILLILCLGLLCFVVSCGSGGDDDNKVDDVVVNNKLAKDSADANKVKVIFYNVPSPVEMTSIIQQSGIGYNPELLNALKNSDKYISTPKIAMNLGVYGADLSYVRIFDQLQESVNYLAIIKKFSEKLGIPNDRGTFTVERLEENVNNRDSLLNIISETYANADVYLKENNRGSTATLIIMGGWVEGLYIATAILDEKKPSPDILKRIGEQKFSLDNLIELMSVYKQDENIALYLPKLDELKKVYETVNISPVNPQATTDTKNKVTTIDSKSEVKITMENVKSIRQLVNSIRAEIIK